MVKLIIENSSSTKKTIDSSFFICKYNPDTSPVLLWLQGGPGGSSLFGLFNEHGPFKVKSDNTLEPRSTTWALTHNMIYIDNPVGTGMSLVTKISYRTFLSNLL